MRGLCLAAAAAAFLTSVPAIAADFSFTGTIARPSSIKYIDFQVSDPTAPVTLRSLGYAGGVNAAGDTISSGGFDTLLTVFSLSTGAWAGLGDDGSCGQVGIDPASGFCYDAFLSTTFESGRYRIALTSFPNYALGNLDDGFLGSQSFNGRNNSWALDILNVDWARVDPVPEAATWAMMIAGFGIVGVRMRRDKSARA